jgi:uncharacterized protein involved in type VI secretion and phage assembly
MPQPSNRFLGKFRGRVVDNNDPQRRGRIRAEVTDVLGREPSSWALPCLPFTAEHAGHYNVPQPGAGVWIEFEQGDPSFPIWSGCWYGTGDELPPDAVAAQQATPPSHPVVIQTPAGSKLVLEDTPGGGILLQAGGASVRIDGGGVHVEDGSGGTLTLANGALDVNNGGLTVPRKQ